jgi:uncharacterized cupredoxin-like copper-binding protein
MRRLVLFVVLALGGALVAACSSDSSDKSVDVAVTEYSLKPSPAHVDAGNVEIKVKNSGSLTHEFVVVRADSVASLPVAKDGSVDEDKIAETDKMGELEDIASGASKSKTFDLPAGNYVMFCNVVDEGPPKVVHFHKGMSSQFTVGS